MDIILDGLELEGMEDLHDRFAALFPPHYGRNLDALFDCLTELGKPVTVILRHPRALTERLGPRAGALEALLRRAAEENSRLTLTEEP